MRFSQRGAACAALVLALSACSDDAMLNPRPLSPALSSGSAAEGVRLNEIHYDNSGTDTGEAIEIAGPAGTDLSGWSVVLHNGNGGAPYSTRELSGTIPALCGTQGVVVLSYPSNGIQNGSPDGVALVDAAGRVVEFLSYEGAFRAVGGPADGMESTNIGVEETSSTPVGESLQRDADGRWLRPAAATFGACNDAPPPPPGPTTVVIHELMGDPLAAASASWGEWFEVHNYGLEPVNLAGWRIRSGGDAEHTIVGDVTVPAGGYAVLSRSDNLNNNGGIAVEYSYYTGGNTLWLDASDWLVLRSPAGATVDSVRWSLLPTGATRALRDPAADNADVDGASWGFSDQPYGSGDFGTPGAANGALSGTAPAVPSGVVRITFSGRDASDPPLPVGFQDQLFATARNAAGTVVSTPLTWSSATPELASVDQDGVVTALAAGTAVIHAVSADGRVGTYRLPTRVPVASATADYRGNTEFGEPSDADSSDDFLIRRAQFTSSYNPLRGTPNWVSYNLEASHFGAEDRCDCFTADALLPAGFPRITTADYTGAGAYHGYRIDRGHLVRSADRTGGSLDNATTFYFSNIIPQTADNNQGPWAALESHLGNLARGGSREVYIVTGVAGSRGTVKDQGKIVIPESVWKVAVILPRDQGLGGIDDAGDFELIAVDMPNVDGIRGVAWTNYQTVVDSIEARAGYDVLALLPNHIEWLVESGLRTAEGAAPARLLGILTAGVEEMTARGQLQQGTGTSLVAKLAAAADQLSGGNAVAVRGQLRAFENEVDALVRSGRLSRQDGESLVILSGWTGNALR